MASNATPEAARAGWTIFKSSGFRTSIEEINEALAAAGYGPIHNRTYQHYRNLARAGYDHYLSINRFDIARASIPYEGATTASRYLFHQSTAGIRMTFVRQNAFFEAFGTASEISEAGAVLTFDDSLTVSHLDASQLRTGDPVLIWFLETSASTPGRVADVMTPSDTVVLEVDFVNLQPVGAYTGRTALSTAGYSITAVTTDSGELSADLVGRRVYFLFETVDASRAFINSIFDEASSTSYAEPARLDQLSVASPLFAIFGIPSVVIGVIYYGANRILKLFRQYEEARLSKSDADYRRLEVDEKALNLDVKRIEMEMLRRAYEEATGEEAPAEGLSRSRAILERQLLPTLRRLAAQGVHDLKIDPTDGFEDYDDGSNEPDE